MVKKIADMLNVAQWRAATPFVWPALYAILLVVGLTNYLPYNQANFWLGIVAVGLYIRYPVAKTGGFRFLFATILCLGLYLLLPVKTVLFFVLVSALLFSLEAISGRLHAAVFPAIFLMSPVANYIAEVFSFPVRLQLSQWAAKILQFTGNEVVAMGNSISFNGALFDVDHACMGLSMLVSSLLMGLISMRLYEAKLQRRLPLVYLPIVLVFFMGFNVCANLIRIICLVYFQIGPGSAMHETIGLACWVLYGIIPSVWLMKNTLKKLGKVEPARATTGFKQPILRHYGFSQFALVLLLGILFKTQHGRPVEAACATPQWLVANGYSRQLLPHGVTQYKNDSTLIYLKSIVGFYSTDHNPSICWRGSGYSFTRVRQAAHGNAL
ncbi:MAG: exosortase N, partial [Bacteroidetes bacterium]